MLGVALDGGFVNYYHPTPPPETSPSHRTTAR
jgi:hypothetical protein